MTIYSRFKALPRARKGTTAVIIVEEEVLRKLIYDATWKHPEVSDQFRPATGPLTTITGGAAGGPPMTIQMVVDSHPERQQQVVAAEVEEMRRNHPQRGLRGW